MKKLFTLAVALFSLAAFARSDHALNYGYGNSFIFVEQNVEFSIYPDGQFDFYYQPQGNFNVQIQTPNVNISYNNGYNYSPFVQLDDFGAVVQIENIPIFYDYYGRIVQAGNVHINYNRFGRVSRIGRLFVHYNPRGYFSHCTGFINRYNTNYVYRPWHRFYVLPPINRCVVYAQPYRTYYRPNRVAYHRYRSNYSNNSRSNFYRPSDRVSNYRYGTRIANKRAIANNSVRSNNTEVRSRSNNSVSNRANIVETNTRNNNSSTRNNTREIRRENVRNYSTIENVPKRSSTRTSEVRNNASNRNQYTRNTRSSSSNRSSSNRSNTRSVR